ncbi:M56 family metallopeptidase [Undibacterium flavidum]|uniref:M56 family metallopeptidase n=1 Tax=Undibacterium flavidum TaxID=2762297 RepID=A0ABR6YD01_9BURK|nr:M56 family metallopeptidase [Undibacterium flavidum]MBC3874424.1 M56 family metallopeptidase [Undibacterium flavidum]
MSFDLNNALISMINAIGWALIHFVWQGILIAVITAVLLLFCRNARAQTRYFIACLGLIFCFLIPAWQVSQAFHAGVDSLDALTNMGTQYATTVRESSLRDIGSWLQININNIVFYWSLIVGLLGLRLSLGLWWLRGYAQGQRGTANVYWQQQLDRLAQSFVLPNRVVLRVVQDLESPITIGWLRPMILVPASLITGMTPAHLEALLAHELAHIARYDYLVNFIQNVIEMFLFFHPAVWWISKKIRNERENIADDLAASMLGEPRRLALALQELELLQFTTPQLAQAAHGGNLMSRIKRLIRPEVQSINWKSAVTAVGIAAACVGLAANAAIPTISQQHSNLVPNSVQSTASDSFVEKDSTHSAEIENLSPDQTSQPMSETTLSKSKVRSDKDVIVAARVNFAKTGCTPEYPREALRNESQGISRILVSLSAKGRIEQVIVKKSSGFPLLDDAVKNQLLSGKCTGKPGTLNGKPQASEIQVEYVWKLD